VSFPGIVLSGVPSWGQVPVSSQFAKVVFTQGGLWQKVPPVLPPVVPLEPPDATPVPPEPLPPTAEPLPLPPPAVPVPPVPLEPLVGVEPVPALTVPEPGLPVPLVELAPELEATLPLFELPLLPPPLLPCVPELLPAPLEAVLVLKEQAAVAPAATQKMGVRTLDQ
jgi:hypothetical protein